MSKIAVLGFGVVGSGTVELLYKNKKSIEEKAGMSLDIKYILDIRDFPDSPFADKFVKDINIILEDDEVDIVAEVMGGLNPSFDFVRSCLTRGKSVVTSNKELVAAKGAELLKIAKEHNCNFFFEASVGGAIPIIRPLHQCLAANEITEIAGILNGTTNFILTKMISDEMSFYDALGLAQSLGYAEKDPTADVEGFDACRKICILSSLAFGKHVYPDQVHTEGISNITLQDIEYANDWGGEVKLIGQVKKLENGKVLPLVSPCFVPKSNQLSTVDDVFNAIMVKGDAIDRVMFYGRGAGKFPTASAVVADIIDAGKSTGTSISQTWIDGRNNQFVENYQQNELEMYVRINADDRENAIKKITEIFGSVDFLSRKGREKTETAFVTPLMAECKIAEKLEKLSEFGITILNKIRVLNF
ncbi:MAG: homoserine dehydrogenase [Oscillospiraceae bacterium]